MYRSKAGTVVGTNVAFGPYWRRGHRRTLRAKPIRKRKSKREKLDFTKKLVDEVCGYAPYETRIMEQFELREKKVRRFARRRLGSCRRSRQKVDRLVIIASDIRRKEKAWEERQAAKAEGEGEQE